MVREKEGQGLSHRISWEDSRLKENPSIFIDTDLPLENGYEIIEFTLSAHPLAENYVEVF